MTSPRRTNGANMGGGGDSGEVAHGIGSNHHMTKNNILLFNIYLVFVFLAFLSNKNKKTNDKQKFMTGKNKILRTKID